jgi:hypothetical protein
MDERRTKKEEQATERRIGTTLVFHFHHSLINGKRSLPIKQANSTIMSNKEVKTEEPPATANGTVAVKAEDDKPQDVAMKEQAPAAENGKNGAKAQAIVK